MTSPALDTRPGGGEPGGTGPGELVVDTEPEPVAPERRSIWQWIGIPIAVVVIVVGIAVYLQVGTLDAASRDALTASALLGRTWEHIQLTAISTFFVLIIALPLGILITRKGVRLAAPVVVGLANIGAAAPSVGLLVLFAMWIGIGRTGALMGLTAYAILPVLRNTITGLQGIDPTLIEAGRGMGMSAARVLFTIELPLAIPVILAGIRTALVLVVGTAALAGFVSAGGLGYFIDLGIKLSRTPPLLTGALLIAAIALLVDWLGQVVEYVARPKGV